MLAGNRARLVTFFDSDGFVWALEFFWFLHDVFERYKTGGMFDLRP
jgi:hypothetical protein